MHCTVAVNTLRRTFKGNMMITETNFVQHIADTLTNGFDENDLNVDDQPMTAFDYLGDALDIEYIVNGKGEYLGARVLVAFGGPNIWVNTRTNTVEGHWWADSCTAKFEDNIGLDEALKELWNCR